MLTAATAALIAGAWTVPVMSTRPTFFINITASLYHREHCTSVRVERRVDNHPAGDRTRRGRKGAPLGIDLAGLVLGRPNVTGRVRNLRVGGVAHRVPGDA